MVQGAKRDLLDWFNNTIEEFQKWEEQRILRRIANAYIKHGVETEKKIFKYISRYVVNRYRPPSQIEGMEIDYPEWEPLNPKYTKKKGHKRKYFYSGDFQRYLNKDDAQYWYRQPKVAIDFTNKIVTYYSMFREGRKPFMALDPNSKVLEESKIQMTKDINAEEKGMDNDLRPLFYPMEDFLLNKKLNAIIDEDLRKYMESEYENEQFIPSAGEL